MTQANFIGCAVFGCGSVWVVALNLVLMNLEVEMGIWTNHHEPLTGWGSRGWLTNSCKRSFTSPLHTPELALHNFYPVFAVATLMDFRKRQQKSTPQHTWEEGIVVLGCFTDLFCLFFFFSLVLIVYCLTFLIILLYFFFFFFIYFY